MNPTETTPPAPRPHQGDDLDPRSIMRVTAIFVGGLTFSLLVLAVMFHYFTEIYPNRASEAAPRVPVSELPPPPRLQTTPALDLAEVRAAEDRHLARYAWIDRQHDLAQIPIDRAMSLWVQTQGGAAATNPPAATSPSPLGNTLPPTNAAPAATTELQMRQDKAKEAAHAP